MPAMSRKQLIANLPSRPFACELRIEQSSALEHGARDVEEPINDRAQGAGMAVTFGSEGLVFSLADGVVANRVLRPVIGGVSQSSIAGMPAQHHAALAASSCYGGGST